jgi:hypothetical protein
MLCCHIWWHETSSGIRRGETLDIFRPIHRIIIEVIVPRLDDSWLTPSFPSMSVAGLLFMLHDVEELRVRARRSAGRCRRWRRQWRWIKVKVVVPVLRRSGESWREQHTISISPRCELSSSLKYDCGDIPERKDDILRHSTGRPYSLFLIDGPSKVDAESSCGSGLLLQNRQWSVCGALLN